MKPDLSLITSTATLKTSFTWYNATTALNSTSVKPNDDLKTVATNTADQLSTHLIFPNPTQSQNIFLLMITLLKTSIFKRTLDLKRHPIWNKVYDHSKNHHLKISLIHRTFTFNPPPPPPTPHPPPHPPPALSCSPYINNFLLAGNRLSFYCYGTNLNLFCNFRNQAFGSKAYIFHFSQESFLLSCFSFIFGA